MCYARNVDLSLSQGGGRLHYRKRENVFTFPRAATEGGRKAVVVSAARLQRRMGTSGADLFGACD